MAPIDDEFLPPAEFTPHVQTPGWIVYAALSPQAHAVASYLYGHVNPSDGAFTVIPSHASIATYLGAKSDNSARRYIKELKDAGMLDAVPTFWDRKAKQRTTHRVRDDGVKNDQTSNTYRLRWAPPQGRLHPGPMNSDEWHHPAKIQNRIAKETARNQAAQPTPLQHSEGGREQEERKSSQVATPLTQLQGPPSTELGDPPHSVEDEVEQEKKNHQPTKGWVVGEQDNRNDRDASEPETAGSSLLWSLGITGRALTDWNATVDTGLAQLGEHQVREILVGGRMRPGPGAIITTRLPQLRTRLASPAPSSSAAQDSKPQWCESDGSDDDPCHSVTRQRTSRESGAVYRCPQCHPHTQQQPVEVARHSQQAETAPESLLDELGRTG